MATIINQSDIQHSIVGVYPGKDAEGKPKDEQYKYTLPPRKGDARPPRIEVPDLHARHWSKRSQAFKAGLVTIQYPPSVSVTKGKPAEGEKEKFQGDIAELHWKTAVAAVNECDDLDGLATMHETEERPRVIEAIEARMVELRG